MTEKIATVLVVDDEKPLRELLVGALAADNIRVQAAASGREAVRLARKVKPDILVTDLRLDDCTGLDVIDRLRDEHREIPAVVITGFGDAASLSSASRRRPLEVMTKPLDLDHLRETIHGELRRQEADRATRRRLRRLRSLARAANRQRKRMHRCLNTTCADLTAAYRSLSTQLSLHEAAINYHHELITARNDDEVFEVFFRLFALRSGPLFGVALVCNARAELNVIGRFGVPSPDSPEFCKALCQPLVGEALADPRVRVMDLGERTDRFDASIRRYLAGVTVVLVPLIPEPGELIGLAVLYRKGEQPFTDGDVSLAHLAGYPTALAVQRND